LVMDPVLDYSTYLGGSDGDQGNGFALDSSGNAYITGYTWSTDFPTTSGAYQTAFGGGSQDAFVTKLNATGTGLVYSTYLGGNHDDTGDGITVDSNGNAYVSGYTASTNFPTTSGAYQTTFGGYIDVFAAKLGATGTLVYSTYIGGSDDEYGHGIAADSSGNAYVTGSTSSTDFPTTSGAYQTTNNNGLTSVFVTKLNATGTGLVYSTFLGTGYSDSGNGIAVNGDGNAYVAGNTNHDSIFPTTAGSFQTSAGAFNEGFVTKLNAAGSGLDYSTYLGGSGDESISSIALDPGGNIYVTGYTSGGTFPITPGAFQTTFGGGLRDAFVAKLNSTGTGLVYSTYLGGGINGIYGVYSVDEGYGIAIDSGGNAFVTGYTETTDFPTTSGAYQTTFNASLTAFMTKLNSTGTGLAYSTFLGGETGCGIVINSSGNAYVMGGTASTDFPTTSGAYQTSFNGGYQDVFVTKFDVSAFYTPTITSTPTATCTPTATDTPTATVTPTATHTPFGGCTWPGIMGNLGQGSQPGSLAGFLTAERLTLPEWSSVAVAYIDLLNASGQCKMAVYADNAGSPGALLGATAPVAAVNGQNLLAFSPALYLAPGSYWIAFQLQNGTQIYYNNGGGTAVYKPYTWNSFPATYPAGGSPTSAQISIAAYYCIAPSPTHTPTVTATPTVTDTTTASMTPTASLTATPSASPTPTVTLTPTPCGNMDGGVSGHEPSSLSINLTSAGSLDWAHWGLVAAGSPTYFDHRNGSNIISDVTYSGNTPASMDPSSWAKFSWSDGTPVASTSNNSRSLMADTVNNGAGFQFTVPALTSVQSLTVYAGLASGGSGRFTAHLSDASAPDYVDYQSADSGLVYAYTVNFKADSAGQTLTVSWVKTTAGTHLYLHAAALNVGSLPPCRTSTPTTTSTPSKTETSTPSPSVTGTPTPCTAPGLQTSYTFDSSLDCWKVDASSTSVVTVLDISSGTHHTGTGSLHAYIVEPSSPLNVFLNVQYATPQDLTGRTLSAWVYVDAALAGCGALITTQSGSGWTFAGGGYTGLTAGTWTKLTWTPSFDLTGEDGSQVPQIGVQFINLPSSTSGNVYIDDFTISDPIPTVACTPYLFNGFETLTENGTLQVVDNATFALSDLHVTQGTQSLDLNITTAAGWNDKIFKLAGFAPVVWDGHSQLLADVYVDSGVVQGASYARVNLYADSNDGGGQYYKLISSSSPNLKAGQQTLAWKLDFPDAITSGMALSDIFFIYNNNASPGTSHIYVDNVRLACSACPPTATTTSTSTPTGTSTPTATPILTGECGYLAWAGDETAPITEGITGATTYIYATTANAGRKDFVVEVPSSGAYKMSASVSASGGTSDTWYVQIQGMPDTNNVGKSAFCVLTKGAFHSEDVSGSNGAGGTRYWILSPGRYIVSWSGREPNCGLECFRLVPVVATPTPTLSPTQTPTTTSTVNPMNTCGYLAWAGDETAPILEGITGGTLYIYSTTANAGRKDFTVTVPSAGMYKMSASVSAAGGTSDTWNVQIQGALDTNNLGLSTFCVLTKGAFHTEEVNSGNGSRGTRLWNLSAGQYIVSWTGREPNCALECFNLVPVSATPTPTMTATPNPTANCGYSAWAGSETAPILEAIAGDTTYIYTNTANAGRKDFTVNVPVSGTYKMSASVSAASGTSDTWYVQIQSVPDTAGLAKSAFCVLYKGAFHMEAVNGGNGASGTRYWNLPAGQYTVSWSGREPNCALACFNLIRVSDLPTATPTITATPNPEAPPPDDGGGGDAPPGDEPPPDGGGGGDAPPGDEPPPDGGEAPIESSMMFNRLTPTPTWDGRLVVAAPNVSRDNEPIQFQIHTEQAGPIQLEIYSLSGERVYAANIVGRQGENTLFWNLQNQAGSSVASGLYLYRVNMAGQVHSGKIAVIH
jgi:hypothetical protein